MAENAIFDDGRICITPETIAVDGKTYFVSTASSVSVIHRPRKVTLSAIILFAICVIFAVFGYEAAATDVSAGPTLIILGISAFSGMGALRFVRPNTYVLALAMSSGETDLLQSADRAYMVGLKTCIETAFKENAKSRSAELVVSMPGGHDADHKICPSCAETVKAAAIKCRYCGQEFPRVIDA